MCPQGWGWVAWAQTSRQPAASQCEVRACEDEQIIQKQLLQLHRYFFVIEVLLLDSTIQAQAQAARHSTKHIQQGKEKMTGNVSCYQHNRLSETKYAETFGFFLSFTS